MLALVPADMPIWLPWLLMSGGGLIVLVVVLYATFRRPGPGSSRWLPWQRWQDARRAGRSSVSSAPSVTPSAPPTPTIDDLHRLAREVIADLDARSERLEALTAAADERIAALRDLTRAPAGTRVHPRSPARELSGERGPLHAESAPPDRAALGSPAPSRDELPPQDALSSRILALAEQGHTPVQIAQRLGQGVGTVELVLALNR